MTISQTLNEAADLIERDGWTQSTYHRLTDDGKVCHCAEGAIGLVTGYHTTPEINPIAVFGVSYTFNEGPYDEETGKYSDNRERDFDAADVYLAGFLNAPSVPYWNDNEVQTTKEVVATLRAAAEMARSEGL